MSVGIDDYMTVTEASEAAGLSRPHIAKLCREGRIPGVRTAGKIYLIPSSWAESFLEDRERTVSIKEAAEKAGVTRGGVIFAVKTGKLVKAGRRITKESFDGWMEARGRRGTKE